MLRTLHKMEKGIRHLPTVAGLGVFREHRALEANSENKQNSFRGKARNAGKRRMRNASVEQLHHVHNIITITRRGKGRSDKVNFKTHHMQ